MKFSNFWALQRKQIFAGVRSSRVYVVDIRKELSFVCTLILNKQMLPRKIWSPHEILNTELVNMEKIREFPATSWSVIYIYRLLPTIFVNPFQAKVQFLHPLKTSKNFYDVFRGYRNLMLAWNGLNAWNPCVAVEKWPTLRFDQLWQR